MEVGGAAPDAHPAASHLSAAAADAAAGAHDDADSGEDPDEPARFPSREASGARTASGDAWQPGTTAWVPEALLKRRRAGGVTTWLVKWRYVVEPSWESEDDLVDEGHGKMIEDFAAIAVARAKPPRRPPREPREPVVSMKGVFDPCVFWPDFEQRVVRSFNGASLQVESIELCCPESASRSLMKQWEAMRNTGTPVAPAILFHGTSDYNWYSIATRGFYVSHAPTAHTHTPTTTPLSTIHHSTHSFLGSMRVPAHALPRSMVDSKHMDVFLCLCHTFS
jgi:hypothetical protein